MPARDAAGYAVGRVADRIFLAALSPRDPGVSLITLDGGGIALAVADPTDLAARRAAEIVLGPNIDIRIAAFDDVATVLDQRLVNGEAEDGGAADGFQQLREDDIESLRDLASGAPVVRAVNDLLEKAIELRASDIHIEPFLTGLVVRMRVDGLLRPVTAPAGVLPQAVISRIKIIASLNIAERRLPQDGAARLRVGRTDIDIRVAIMPTQHGESAVIRCCRRIADCWSWTSSASRRPMRPS